MRLIRDQGDHFSLKFSWNWFWAILLKRSITISKSESCPYSLSMDFKTSITAQMQQTLWVTARKLKGYFHTWWTRLQFGVFHVFSPIKKMVNHQLHMYCALSVKITRVKCDTVHEDCWSVLFAFVPKCVVGKNPITPNWSSLADDAITQNGIGVLGSPFYICG